MAPLGRSVAPHSYWQRLSSELGLGGAGPGGRGGSDASSLPSIDEVMARLRDQAQLHLQVWRRLHLRLSTRMTHRSA